MERDTKLFASDLEGTLFYPMVEMTHGVARSIWTYIAQLMGPEMEAAEEETKKKWQAGWYGGSYIKWMDATAIKHKELGLTKDTYDEAHRAVKYHPGVREVFSELGRRRIHTAALTGGFKTLADRAVRDLGVGYAFAACEYHWDEKGNLDRWNLMPFDYQQKAQMVRMVLDDLNIDPERAVFVGDGPNDKWIAQEVGTSISFNGAEELEKASTYAIQQPKGQEDFRAVLEYI